MPVVKAAILPDAEESSRETGRKPEAAAAGLFGAGAEAPGRAPHVPYAVFAICSLLSGLFVAWLRLPSTFIEYEYQLYVIRAAFFGLGALVLPFLLQRDLRD